MIRDIENEVYTLVSKQVKAAFPDISMSSEYIRKPAKFPHVYLAQTDSPDYTFSMDSSGIHHVSPTFTVEIFSNKISGKKSECKAVASIVREAFAGLGFVCMSMVPIPNMNDASIYRMTGRFRAVSDGKYVFQ